MWKQKIKNGQPKEKNDDYLFRAGYSKGVSHHLSKEGRSVGKPFRDQREDSRYGLNGGSGRGEAVGRLLRSGASSGPAW